MGTRWRIGDGKTVKIWKYAWIGGEGSGKLISPVNVLDENATVDALIDQDNHLWRTDLLQELLLLVDIDRILKIPISSSSAGDERVWAVSNDGIFKVRDAYRITLKVNDDTPSSSGTNSIWGKLWKLNIPPKARIFLWRAFWDIYSPIVQI